MLRFKSIVVIMAIMLMVSGYVKADSIDRGSNTKIIGLSEFKALLNTNEVWFDSDKGVYRASADVFKDIRMTPVNLDQVHQVELASDSTDTDGWPPVKSKARTELPEFGADQIRLASDGTDTDGWPPNARIPADEVLDPGFGRFQLASDGTDTDGWPPYAKMPEDEAQVYKFGEVRLSDNFSGITDQTLRLIVVGTSSKNGRSFPEAGIGKWSMEGLERYRLNRNGQD